MSVRTIFLGCLLLFILAFVFSMPAYVLAPQELKQGTAVIGGKEITILVADSARTITTGLGNRDSLDQDMGMLFVFPAPERHGIWMKNMRFPIDIFWIDELGKIVDIEENILPDTFPTVFLPKETDRYVLETNAGFAKKEKIKRGDTLLFTVAKP